VTRHSVLVVPSFLIGTVDVDGKLDGPAMTVEFPCQVMLDDVAPSFREFLLDRLSLSDNRHHVHVAVCQKVCETLAIVEFSVKQTQKLSEDTAGGVAVDETAHRQRVSVIPHTRVECRIGVERRGSTLCL